MSRSVNRTYPQCRRHSTDSTVNSTGGIRPRPSLSDKIIPYDPPLFPPEKKFSTSCTSTVPPTSCSRVLLLLSFSPSLPAVGRLSRRVDLDTRTNASPSCSSSFLRYQSVSTRTAIHPSLYRTSAKLPQFAIHYIRASIASPFVSDVCALFIALAALFQLLVLCFQSFAHSSTKTRGHAYRAGFGAHSTTRLRKLL